MKNIKELNSRWYWRLAKLIYLIVGILFVLLCPTIYLLSSDSIFVYPSATIFKIQNVVDSFKSESDNLQATDNYQFASLYITIHELQEYSKTKPLTQKLIYTNLALGKTFEGMVVTKGEGYYANNCPSITYGNQNDIIFQNLIKGTANPIFLSQACVDVMKESIQNTKQSNQLLNGIKLFLGRKEKDNYSIRTALDDIGELGRLTGNKEFSSISMEEPTSIGIGAILNTVGLLILSVVIFIFITLIIRSFIFYVIFGTFLPDIDKKNFSRIVNKIKESRL